MPSLAAEVLLQTGADIFGISQDLVPVDSGDLKRSGGVIPISPQKVIVGYGNDEVDYAIYVEYGTESSPAQPFLTPSFMQSEQAFEKRFKEAVEKKVLNP